MINIAYVPRNLPDRLHPGVFLSKFLISKTSRLTGLCILLACSAAQVLAQGPAVNVIRLDDSRPSNAPASSVTLSSDVKSVVKDAAAVGKSNGAASNSDASSQTQSANPESPTQLTGGASVVHLELANVRDILLDVRRAKEFASHLNGEVTRHPITSYNYVDSMGPVMMEIPMPTFDMSQVLPARKHWVDLYMGEMSPIISFVKTDLDGIVKGESDLALPDKDKATFDKDLQECSASIEKVVSCGDQLKKLTVAPPYDNVGIAKLTSEMHKDLRDVEKTTRRMIGQIKKAH